jgi:hypothetical protein
MHTSESERAVGEMLSRIEEDETYFNRICFSNVALIYVFEAVNRNNCHVFGGGGE